MASSNITVVTCVTDAKDNVLKGHNKGKANWVAFTDGSIEMPEWEVRKAYDRFKDPMRNSRIHKILIHQFIDTEYSIWLDGNIRLCIPPEEVVASYLKDHDWAMWKHPNRDCIYDEAIACAKRKLDDPEVIIEQAVTYEKAGFPKKKGLCEGCFIVRRRTPKVEQLNNAWWSEYCRHSRRDQISFMYAADKVGLRINAVRDPFIVINEILAKRESGIAEIHPHKKLNLGNLPHTHG